MNLPGIHSLRARILLLVIGGVLIPLAITGVWLNGFANRASESIVASSLDRSLDRYDAVVTGNWSELQRMMIRIGGHPTVQQRLARAGQDVDSSLPPIVVAMNLLRPRGAIIGHPVFRSADGKSSWTIQIEPYWPDGHLGRAPINISVPVVAHGDTNVTGRINARIAGQHLLFTSVPQSTETPAIVWAYDHASGVRFGDWTSADVDSAMRSQESFELDDQVWLVRRRTLREPRVTIAVADRRDQFAVGFHDAAARGIIALIAVAAFALALSLVFSRRISRSLVDLANATDAVAAGDFDHRVETHSNDEVNRVGRAFNAMTESLRTSLAELSQREALAAVGGFAASLAHEVRNPLTSIRIDLQRVEERLPADSPLRVHLSRALREVARLDHTVGGALRVARSGQVALGEIDLGIPLQRAIEVARSAFDLSGAVLNDSGTPELPILIRGDEAALEQVFLNILLNAAQALEPGKTAGVTVRTEAGHARLDFWDVGAGIPRELVDRVFDPFVSTKKDGTGLGLAVARQIIIAHSGSITIDSTVDGGTTVTIRIPVMT